MKVSLLQTDIVRGDVAANLARADRMIGEADGDVVVLPEMFATGYMADDASLAEPMDGRIVGWMRATASGTGRAVAGSVAVRNEGLPRPVNRFCFADPDGGVETYDKRHLFSFGGEDGTYMPGRERKVLSYRGVRFLPQICYDLRFPVWSRNRNDYDAIIYVASWPSSRIEAWDALLRARAIENQCYVFGVNRVGDDPAGHYDGHTAAFDFMGRRIASVPPDGEGCATAGIDLEALAAFRAKFAAWRDADDFSVVP